MAKVSTPLLGLLLACLAFFALWFVALKPSTSTTASTAGSSSTAESPHSSIPNGSAIDKAQAAVSTADRASAAQNNANVTQSTSSTATSTLAARPAIAATSTAATASPSTAAAKSSNPAAAKSSNPAAAKATNPATATASSAAELSSPAVAVQALADRKVLAILFYNPAGADDLAVRKELAAVPTERGLVVKLAVPLADLSAFSVVTNHVAVNESPTLVLVDSRHSATTIIGFADRFEIAQRVTDALAVG